jgi:thiosulfate reductase / polysulfide reductase chain A
VHVNTTLAASDRGLLIKPGTDGALALAIAHVILTEGLWERPSSATSATAATASCRQQRPAGDFRGEVGQGPRRLVEHRAQGPHARPGRPRSPTFRADILAVAREFGTTRPAIALFERGAHAHSNGIFNGMAIHTLNALVGSLFAKGGLMYQMGPSYGPMPVDAADYMDDYAKNGPWKSSRGST